MSTDEKKEFFDLLRDRFAPDLRKVGFKGTGQNFRRVQSEIINAINIQVNKYGGSVAVNLGLHLTFLPVCWSNEMPDLVKVKQVDCEFRVRLAPRSKTDYWWKYSRLFRTCADQVDHLMRTYWRYGESRFQEFDSIESIVNRVSPADVAANRPCEFFGYDTPVRAGLTWARIHKHLGNDDLSRDFARAGLRVLGRATSLRAVLEGLAK